MNKDQFILSLETKIQNAYETSPSVEEAEKLAGEFLYAQLKISKLLTSVDLDARMKKTGVKALRSALYLNIVSASDKKPTEAAIEASISSDEMVTSAVDQLDKAEVERDELKRVFDVCTQAHVHFRQLAKGSFGV